VEEEEEEEDIFFTVRNFFGFFPSNEKGERENKWRMENGKLFLSGRRDALINNNAD